MTRLLHKNALLSALLIAACTSGALAASWTWTGLGVGDGWRTSGNWSVVGFGVCFYPCSTADDVHFPVVGGGGVWGDVVLDFVGDLTIDDMSICDSVDFVGSDATAPDLIMDTFVVDADDAAVTVTWDEKMTFTANPPSP